MARSRSHRPTGPVARQSRALADKAEAAIRKHVDNPKYLPPKAVPTTDKIADWKTT